jgi:hypothetical protein
VTCQVTKGATRLVMAQNMQSKRLAAMLGLAFCLSRNCYSNSAAKIVNIGVYSFPYSFFGRCG